MTPSEIRRVVRAARRAPGRPTPLDLLSGVETRTPRDRYRWDGLRRGADGGRPFLVYQQTIAGHGVLETGGRTHTVGRDRAFLATVPSAHLYAVPPDSRSWRFFWMIIRHPYVVRRLTAALGAPAVLLDTPGRSPLTRRSVELFERAARAGRPGADSPELALFAWMLEVETTLARDPARPGEKDRLLEEVRRCVLEDLSRPPDVTGLAARQGTGRSQYTRRFRRITGRTPARWVLEIRLGEVLGRLRSTDHKLDRIARETGFADATPLCKAFRRHLGLSPGAFRAQGL